MTHTYTVTGMTCNNCKASVEKALSAVDTITSVSVDLESSEVEITMSKHTDISELRNVLPSKYTIKEKHEQNVFQSIASGSEVEKTDMQRLFPLFLILGYVTIASLLLNYASWNWSSFMLDFMGLFYIVFSFFKLLDLKGFSESFKMYDPFAKAIPQYGLMYPFIEVVLGLLFLTRIQIPIALVVTLIVLGITTFGVAKTLLDKKTIQCACLGTALNLPMTKATLIENSIMIIMALAMLFQIYF